MPSSSQSLSMPGAASHDVWGENTAMLCRAAVSTKRDAGASMVNFFSAVKGVGWYVMIRDAGDPSKAVSASSSTWGVTSFVR
jgi:hypothetical protein